MHFSKDVVQYGLAISRKLEVDFEILSLGVDETELPAKLHVHDLTRGNANTSLKNHRRGALEQQHSLFKF